MKYQYQRRKNDAARKYAINQEAEIKPSWRAMLIIALIPALIAAAKSDIFGLFVSEVYADTFIWRYLENEKPASGRLVWIDYGGLCRHLARYDYRSGWFYDDYVALKTSKWVYILDRQPALRPCTSEDLDDDRKRETYLAR